MRRGASRRACVVAAVCVWCGMDVVAVVFLFPLLRMGMFGVGFAAVVTVAGMVYLLRLRLSWQGTAIVATTLRCIDVSRTGFARAVSTAVSWSDVTVVSARVILLSPHCLVSAQFASTWQRNMRFLLC